MSYKSKYNVSLTIWCFTTLMLVYLVINELIPHNIWHNVWSSTNYLVITIFYICGISLTTSIWYFFTCRSE